MAASCATSTITAVSSTAALQAAGSVGLRIFFKMAARKPGVLAKLHSLNESANPDTVKYATGTIDNWRKHHQGAWPPQ